MCSDSNSTLGNSLKQPEYITRNIKQINSCLMLNMKLLTVYESVVTPSGHGLNVCFLSYSWTHLPTSSDWTGVICREGRVPGVK